VAEGVVDRLEAVEVEEEDRDGGARPARLVHRDLEPIEDQRAVR
jgi:hypothetical protein